LRVGGNREIKKILSVNTDVIRQSKKNGLSYKFRKEKYVNTAALRNSQTDGGR